jgi:hypothetical protein
MFRKSLANRSLSLQGTEEVSMRKLFWCGILAVILAAGTVFLTAQYAGSHPDSLAGHCARIAQRAGSALIPLFRAYDVLATRDDPLLSEEEEACCIPEEPQPVEEIMPAELPPGGPSLVEPIDVLQQGRLSHKAEPPCLDLKVVTQGALEVPSPQGVIPATLIPEVTEPSGHPFRPMPTCEDDPGTAPDEMPFISDEAPTVSKDTACLDQLLYQILPSWFFGHLPMTARNRDSSKVKDADKDCCPDYPRDAGEQENGTPDKKPNAARGRSQFPTYKIDQERQGKDRVDTLEYRPSDARQGELGRIPF